MILRALLIGNTLNMAKMSVNCPHWSNIIQPTRRVESKVISEGRLTLKVSNTWG